jgi:O-methyltransferase involved in polyketide biosynthesis
VLHLGCLDTRVFHIDPPVSVNWFDVDELEVIDLREKLYPERDRYHMIGSPLEDLRWLDEVPRDRPALILAEGVLPYLAESDVKALLNAFTRHFPARQMVFDAFLPWAVRKAGSNVGGYGRNLHMGDRCSPGHPET